MFDDFRRIDYFKNHIYSFPTISVQTLKSSNENRLVEVHDERK